MGSTGEIDLMISQFHRHRRCKGGMRKTGFLDGGEAWHVCKIHMGKPFRRFAFVSFREG